MESERGGDGRNIGDGIELLPGEGEVDYAYQVSSEANNAPLLESVSATSGGSPLCTSTLSTAAAGNKWRARCPSGTLPNHLYAGRRSDIS